MNTQPERHIDTAINELITRWVLTGGRGAVPNYEGAHIGNYWIVRVYETLLKAKGGVK